jgi:hypothetical protein
MSEYAAEDERYLIEHDWKPAVEDRHTYFNVSLQRKGGGGSVCFSGTSHGDCLREARLYAEDMDLNVQTILSHYRLEGYGNHADENGQPVCRHGLPTPQHPDWEPDAGCEECGKEEQALEAADYWYDMRRGT